MKKSIISRMKSKKAKLAAGVLAIILGMFPASVQAEWPTTRSIQWINGVAMNPYDMNNIRRGNAIANNPSGWYGKMTLEDVNYIPATGLQYVTNTIFEVNDGNGYRINQNYNTDVGPAGYTMRSGNYISDARAALGMSEAAVYQAQIRLLNNNGGSLILTPWAGHMGVTSNNSYVAMAHHGGVSTLTFKNYNSGTDMQGTGRTDIDGSVMYITAGSYTLRGEANTIYTSGTRSFALNNGNWVPVGNPSGANQALAASYIYFDNNYATSGGAVYNAEGSLTLERVIFGYRYNENDIGTGYGNRTFETNGNHASDRGGAIYNAKTLDLSDVRFWNNTALGDGLNSGGGALYNTAQGVVTDSTYVSQFLYNSATRRGGAIYNAGGSINISAYFRSNTALDGGAVFNAGTLYLNGSKDGAMDFTYNSTTAAAGRGGAVYNDSSGTAYFDNIRFEQNTATGGLGGAIFNQNIVRLTNIQLVQNSAMRGGAIYNDANAAVTTVRGVTFDRNDATENGGAIYNSQGTLNLSGTTLRRNEAVAGLGGAIYTFLGTISFADSELSNNKALEGGAIYSERTILNVASSTFNTNVATTGNGAGIYNNGTLNITGQTLFDGNLAETGFGGAVYNAKLAAINLTNNDLSDFSSNRALEGGAIYNDEGGRLHIVGGSNSRVTFANNVALTGRGGAVFSSLDGSLNLDNVWFTNNTAATDGGAIYSDLRGTLTLSGGQFSENRADGDGGAIYNGADGVLNITGTTFDQNNAAHNGGAIYNDVGGELTLTDVSFTKNTAGNLGGAIYNDSATVNVNVVGKNSGFGDGTANSDSFYFTGTNNVLNVDVANTTYSLLMYGPMIGAAGSDIEITKSGVGIWELETSSTFSGTKTDFTVEEGTLRVKTDKTLNLDGAVGGTESRFELDSPASPVKATNSSTVYTGTASLILEAGSSLITDKFVSQKGSSIVAGFANINAGGAAGFSVNATAFTFGTTAPTPLPPNTVVGGWINSDRFHIDGTTTVIANAYDFQNPNTGGAPSLEAAGLHFENATFLATTGDGPFLDLRSTLANIDVTMDSDIYIYRPQDFVTNGYGVLVLAEVTNGGTFNGGDTTNPTTGNFYIYNGTAYETGKKTPFTRSKSPTLYEGLSLTSNADNTGSWIIYTMMNQNTKSEDLTWTGVDSITGAALSLWNSIDTQNQNANTNWTGSVKGIPVDKFLNGDTVTFADMAKGATVTNKTVTLGEDITVGAMTVTGSGYVFNLDNKSITAEATYGSGAIDFGTNTIINVKNDAGKSGTTITAESITFNTASDPIEKYGLHFDTVNAQNGDEYLTLTTPTGVVVDVASDIYVDTPLPPFTGVISLIKSTDGTLTQTGKLFVDGYVPGPFTRKDVLDNPPTAADVFIGIDLINSNTEIVLLTVTKDTRSEDLTWAGVLTDGTTIESVWNHNNLALQNWRGTVKGNPVTTFLNGDTVTFNNDATNKTVRIGTSDLQGDVMVGEMIMDGSGYTFNLTHGGISAEKVVYSAEKTSNGNINFGDARIINNTSGRTVSAEGTITFAGANNFTFDLAGADTTGNIAMLNLNAAEGVFGTIGDGNFTLNNVTLTSTEQIVLIDVGTSPGDYTIVATGTINGQGGSVDRDVDILGLKAETTQLLLTMIEGGSNTNLYWSGASIITSDISVWNVNSAKNWAGFIGGNYTEKFWNGDTVFFSDSYLNGNRVSTNVDNRHVATAADMTVAAMTVDGTGYTFDLTKGGITATTGDIDFQETADVSGISGTGLTATVGNINFVGGTLQYNGDGTISAGGDINFAEANVLGISGTDAIKAGGDVNFIDGRLGFAGVATISAGGNVDFADVNFGSDNAFTKDGSIALGTTVTAGGTINLNGGNDFSFDLDGVVDGDTIMTLDADNGVTGTVGGGDIYVYDVGLGGNESVVLIETGTDGIVTIGASKLYEDGNLVEFERDTDPTRVILGLATNDTQSQLLLTTVNADANTALAWSGATGSGDWDVNGTENWAGNVGGHYVKTFLPGDTVWFGERYQNEKGEMVNVGQKNVDLTGNMSVGSMTVTGKDYVFNLTDGGIAATGNIDFGSSTILVSYISDETKRTVDATGTIAFAGGNEFIFDLSNANDGDTVLTLDATGGVIGTVGDGKINISINENGFAVGDQIALIDVASDNGNVTASGELWVNGKLVEFERGEEQFALAVDSSNPYALLLTKEKDESSSSNLRWTGVEHPGGQTNSSWDVKTSMNWKGTTTAGQQVYNFVTGDSVVFGNEAANKIVNVTTGGLVTGNLTVEAGANGYTFNLADGGITAQANASTGAAGDIDFGSANLTGLAADAGTVNAARDINFGGGTIGFKVGPSTDNAIITAGRSVTGNATLNIDSYGGSYGDAPTAVIQAGSGTLDGFNFDVTVGGQQVYEADYVSLVVYQGDPGQNGKDTKTIYVEMGLTWYSTDPNRPAHGDFDIKDGTFTIDTVLKDNTVGPYGRGWDGTTLTKEGDGTLILNGPNEYTGGTTINGGTIIAGHVDALGKGEVTNNSEVEITTGDEFDNVFSGTGKVTINPGDGETTVLSGPNTYTGDTEIKSGTLEISDILGAGANSDTKTVIVDDGAAFALTFEGDDVDPCDITGEGTKYNQKIIGDGSVVIGGGGTFVLANTKNSYKGATMIKSGSTLIYDTVGTLGKTEKIDIEDGGAFTIGIGTSGTFTTAISGAGTLYVNPERGGGDSKTVLTFARDNSTFTGDTVVCSGNVKLTHLDGIGSRDTEESSVTLRAETNLEFAVGGEYRKQITGDGSVVKTGGATLTLHNGNSDYTGGTTIRGGELIAGHTNAVGSGDVILDGSNVTFSLLVNAETGGSDFSNRITGNGNVNFGTTAGTLGVKSTKFDFAGKTTITSGTVDLQELAANAWNTDAYDLAVNEDATLIISDAGTLNKNLTGEGTFKKTSSGELVLNGNNSGFYGNINLEKGTTTLGNTDALGNRTAEVSMSGGTTLRFLNGVDYMPIENDITLDGAAKMDTSGAEVTLRGKIDGSGLMTKDGVGTLTLDNLDNTFNGLNIREGKVAGTASGNKDSLGSTSGTVTIGKSAALELFVNEDATLRGRISAATDSTFIKSGSGKLDMGTSYTPFKVGEFVMNGGSLEIQLDPRNSHYVKADSFTQVQESKVIGTYNSVSGLYRGSERAVQFLALRGEGSGEFSEYAFNSNIARVKGEKFFNEKTNELFFNVWLDSFIDAYGDGLSDNAGHAAHAADALPDDNPLMEALTAYENDGGDMVDAFSSLHGEVYMSSIYANADLQRNFNQLILNRRINCEHCREFKQLRGQDARTVQRELWATFTGGGNFRTEFDRFSGYNIGRWGIAGGLEHNFSRGFFTGVALGYDQADLDLSDLPQKDQFYAFRVSAYTNYTIEDVSMTGFLGYSKNWHDVERNINFLGVKSRAKYDDDVLTAGFDIAKTYHWSSINIIPMVGLSYVHVRTPFIKETKAGIANLYVHSDRYDSLRAPMGVRTNSTFNIQGVDFTPEFRAFYIPELANDKVRGYTAYASAPGNSFLVDTGVRGRSGFQIGVGLEAKLFDFMSIGVDYDAEIWSRYTRHDVGANIKLRW